MLNELDMELERRGLRSCRYVYVCNVYVKTKKSSERVMRSITILIVLDLKLKVNNERNKVDRPWKLKYLGYSFYLKKGKMGIRVHPKSIKKLQGKLKDITGRNNAMSMENRAMKLKQLIVGWVSYFKLSDMKGSLKELDEWLSRRL